MWVIKCLVQEAKLPLALVNVWRFYPSQHEKEQTSFRIFVYRQMGANVMEGEDMESFVREHVEDCQGRHIRTIA